LEQAKTRTRENQEMTSEWECPCCCGTRYLSPLRVESKTKTDDKTETKIQRFYARLGQRRGMFQKCCLTRL
jgi:hypothetical protein